MKELHQYAVESLLVSTSPKGALWMRLNSSMKSGQATDPLVRDIEKIATLAEGLINLGEYQAGYRHLYELVSTYGSTYDLNIESENNYISSAGLVSFFPL